MVEESTKLIEDKIIFQLIMLYPCCECWLDDGGLEAMRSATMSPPWTPPACAQPGEGGKGSFEYCHGTDTLLIKELRTHTQTRCECWLVDGGLDGRAVSRL